MNSLSEYPPGILQCGNGTGTNITTISLLLVLFTLLRLADYTESDIIFIMTEILETCCYKNIDPGQFITLALMKCLHSCDNNYTQKYIYIMVIVTTMITYYCNYNDSLMIVQ